MSDEIRQAVEKNTEKISQQLKSRAKEVSNALINAEKEVLKGQRSGRVYKKDGQLYRASAPGEAPAKKNGDLRFRWHEGKEVKSPTTVVAYIQSDMKYASYLENGTSKIAPRPFVERIKEKAMPEIQRIMNEDYS